MRVHVSVDLEGVAGIATLDQVLRGGHGYPRAQALMTAEANAAVRGAFAAGATDVVVSDSHGTMDNLLHDALDPRAELVLGSPRAACMVHGLTWADDAVVFVGYHAEAGSEGVLAHTFSSSFTQVRVNGVPMSEAEVNALRATELGVPVAFLSGDDRICAKVAAVLPGTSTLQVKSAVGWAAAQTLSPAASCERLEEAVATALGRLPVVPPVPEQLVVEVDVQVPHMADLLATVPGTERLGGLTVRREVRDAEELLRLVTAWYHLCALSAQQLGAIAARR